MSEKPNCRLAIVGAGRMGAAVLTGALRAGVIAASDAGIYHENALRGIELAERHGVRPLDEDDLATSDRILIAVKPQSFSALADRIARPDGSYISIMAGVSVATLNSKLGSSRVVRAMPNLGARVGLSSTALASASPALSADIRFAAKLFEAIGSVHHLPEELFDAFTGMAGSGPAFAAVVAEALADGGVRVGLPRAQSRELARQVLLATAMLLEADTPAALKDEVASAGGTAIAGVLALEKHGLRYSIMQAVEQAALRAGELNGREK